MPNQASDLPFYDIFVPQKVHLLKILWWRHCMWFLVRPPPPQLKILATPITLSTAKVSLFVSLFCVNQIIFGISFLCHLLILRFFFVTTQVTVLVWQILAKSILNYVFVFHLLHFVLGHCRKRLSYKANEIVNYYLLLFFCEKLT